MKRTLMITLTCIGILILAIVSAAIVLFVFLQATEYKPPLTQKESVSCNLKDIDPGKKVFSIVTWNIGYSGLGKEMDFFYEGGTMVRPTLEQYECYFTGITRFLQQQDSVDFIFLEEVDTFSKRSYFRNQRKKLESCLTGFGSVFAGNYICRYVPVPINEPMGRVTSGLCCFTRWNPETAIRHGFDANFSWPKRLVMFKRCFLELRYRLENNKELILIELHNSYFDKGGEIRKKELMTLRNFMQDEYRKGNYVITGGDWNMNPPGYNPGLISTGDKTKWFEPPFVENILPGWSLVFDPGTPTNRDVDSPYRKGFTRTSIIDFFILSPNLVPLHCKTTEIGFDVTDHQPVFLTFRLNE